MIHESLKRRNLICVANAIEICTRTLTKVAGRNGTSNKVAGQAQTRQIVADAVAAKLSTTVSDKSAGAN